MQVYWYSSLGLELFTIIVIAQKSNKQVSILTFEENNARKIITWKLLLNMHKWNMINGHTAQKMKNSFCRSTLQR